MGIYSSRNDESTLGQPRDRHDLNLSAVDAVMEHETIGNLPVRVIFRDNIDMIFVLIHVHPMISSRIKVLIRSPL